MGCDTIEISLVIDPDHLPSKFCQNWVINRLNIVDVVVHVLAVVIFYLYPKNLPLKFGQNRATSGILLTLSSRWWVLVFGGW